MVPEELGSNRKTFALVNTSQKSRSVSNTALAEDEVVFGRKAEESAESGDDDGKGFKGDTGIGNRVFENGECLQEKI